ncbi:MAG: amidohydrolase [Clostridiales bacterium]|jgi:5-methylthioadenosine/S-adenosylhomocysteine deaminase|nr:amidohydrolase [Clostridiales bacterium]
MEYLFHGAIVITMCDENPVIENAYVGVTDGKISYIGTAKPEGFQNARSIDCKHKVMLPGLINAHTHIPMTLLRGYADDFELSDWLNNHIWPAEEKMDESAIKAGTMLGIAEMISTGTTSFSDTYFFADAIAEAVSESRIKANLARSIISFDEKVDFNVFPAAVEEKSFVERWHMHDGGRIITDASIHAEYTSGPGLWESIVGFAKEKNVLMQVHLSETRAEHEKCVNKYGKTPAALFCGYGVFDIKTTAAHCVWATDEDFMIFAEKHVTAVHNPVSNLKLASGVARVPEMIKAGVSVALGTDGTASNNSHDMFEEIKLAALLHKGRLFDPTAVNAYEALKLATLNGAAAQGRESECGKIAAGFDADLILVNMDAAHLTPCHNAVSNIVYSARGSDVCFTMARGEVLYENGEYKTLDIERVKFDARRAAKGIV